MTWEMIRITGLVALTLLTVSVSLGIAGPVIRKPTARLASVSMHLTASVGATLLVIGHILLAVVDSWVKVPLTAAVIPGVSTWQPLWVALGTIAFDLMLVMVATSALRQHAPRLWWRSHVVAYPMYALVWLHTLTIGTDRGSTLMIALAAISAAFVAGAITVRMLAPRGPIGNNPRPDLEEVLA